jgi:hypothetical protein
MLESYTLSYVVVKQATNSDPDRLLTRLRKSARLPAVPQVGWVIDGITVSEVTLRDNDFEVYIALETYVAGTREEFDRVVSELLSEGWHAKAEAPSNG